MRFFIVFVLLLSSLSANHINWYANYDKAHQEAIKEGKNLMVFLIKKDCDLCRETLQKSFMNQSYVDNINTKFISVIVMKNQKSSYPIEMLYTLEYPSVFFLDKTELFSCSPIHGDITPNSLKNHLEKCFSE